MTDAEIGGMAVQGPRIYEDVNAVVGGYLRDLAFAQSSPQKIVRIQAGGGGDLRARPAVNRSRRT
jgi:hypothetical protein